MVIPNELIDKLPQPILCFNRYEALTWMNKAAQITGFKMGDFTYGSIIRQSEPDGNRFIWKSLLGDFNFEELRYESDIWLILYNNHTTASLALEQSKTMASVLIHRLRSPLTAMSGFFNMLASQVNDTSLVEVVRKGFSEINTIIDSLEPFTQSVTTTDELINLNALIRDVITQFEAKVKKAVIFIPIEKSFTISTDSGILKSSLNELLMNAAEHSTGDSTDQIQIITNADDRTIIVKNDANPLDKETAKSLFNPFFTTKARNSGLGLTTVYLRLAAINAQIQLYKNSRVDGIQFRIIL